MHISNICIYIIDVYICIYVCESALERERVRSEVRNFTIVMRGREGVGNHDDLVENGSGKEDQRH